MWNYMIAHLFHHSCRIMSTYITTVIVDSRKPLWMLNLFQNQEIMPCAAADSL
jgi:hypothetical protein